MLPQLAKIDGLSMASKLQFEVETFPREMVIKAVWYVDHTSTHFHQAKDRNGDIFYYFLVKANPGGFKKMGKINLSWQRMLTLAKAHAMLLATPRRDS